MLAGMETKTAVVVGVGPGLGIAAARRFARGGFRVALVARRAEEMKRLAAELGGGAMGIGADATDPTSMEAAFDQIGPADVLVYNAGVFKIGEVADIEPEEFESAWKANCFGGFLAAHAVIPEMIARGSGTILFTGATASLRGSAKFSMLAVGKFGLRALAQSLARELGPRGIHVAHVIIDGQIDTPRVRGMMPGRDPSTFIAPESIAELYWQLHAQDRSCWSHEVDLRPATEKF
jgi:NAD(P)-dependent dehydrogenase (short-subunit alcohol dehydrogenase family)